MDNNLQLVSPSNMVQSHIVIVCPAHELPAPLPHRRSCTASTCCCCPSTHPPSCPAARPLSPATAAPPQLIDPYWTLLPLLIAWFYRAHPAAAATPGRARLATALLWFWSLRLTHSYFRRCRPLSGQVHVAAPTAARLVQRAPHCPATSHLLPDLQSVSPPQVVCAQLALARVDPARCSRGLQVLNPAALSPEPSTKDPAALHHEPSTLQPALPGGAMGAG